LYKLIQNQKEKNQKSVLFITRKN